jgi:hypothetical protein
MMKALPFFRFRRKQLCLSPQEATPVSNGHESSARDRGGERYSGMNSNEFRVPRTSAALGRGAFPEAGSPKTYYRQFIANRLSRCS